MDMQHLDILLRIVQVVVLPIVGVLLKLLLDQRKQLAKLDARLTQAEACLQTVPSEKVLHELDLTIREVGGDLHVAVEKISGLAAIVDRVELMVSRHEDFLLNNGGK